MGVNMETAIGRRRARLATVLTLVALLLCLWRGLSLVRHEPMIGLANNYDMIRVQGCIGAWPLRGAEVPPWSNSWQAPIERYTFRDDVDPGCFFSSEALFAFMALPLMRASADAAPDHAFSLKLLGTLKLAALLLAVAGVSYAFGATGSPAGALLNAVVALVVLFDPAVTIYLNAMYAEFAAVFFAYLSVALAAIAIRRPSAVVCVALALAIVLACLSKIQHLAFGLVLLGAAVATSLARERLPRRVVAAALIGAIAGVGLQAWHLQEAATQSMRHANLTNTVLQAVLGSTPAPDRTAMARDLGLPEACAEHAGKTWFSEGVQTSHPCPALFELGRGQIVAALIANPSTMVSMASAGLRKARPWIPDLLGKVESGVSVALPLSFATLDRPFSELPFAAYLAFFFLPCTIVLALVIAARRTKGPAPLLFAMTMCAGYAQVSFASVILGDGFADVAKQFHLGTTALFAFWVLFGGWIALKISTARAAAAQVSSSSR